MSSLENSDPRTWTRGPRPGGRRPVALLLPGQGSQYAGMATGLYGHERVFTAAIDEVLELMGADGARVREDWLSHVPAVHIDDVRRAQPLLFAVDYALGRLLLSWGIEPVAMLGHSAGEVVAATLAGVFSLGDAVRVQLDRVRQATRIPAGGMLAVAASAEQVRPYLVGDAAVAAVNSPRQTMLAGTTEALRTVERRLREDEYVVAVVPATSPFHCSAMAPAATATELGLRSLPLRPPARTVYSGYTGSVMRAVDATSPRFWARQLTDTVYFGPALDSLLARQDVLLVEAGPGQVLTAIARRHRAVRSRTSDIASMLPARRSPLDDDGAEDRRHVLGVAARLWDEGYPINRHLLVPLWRSIGHAPTPVA